VCGNGGMPVNVGTGRNGGKPVNIGTGTGTGIVVFAIGSDTGMGSDVVFKVEIDGDG
jgi:hypothetical protein